MESILLYLIDHFPDLMDINLTASIVILFVLCIRHFLKRAPKIFSYVLWGIVLLRVKNTHHKGCVNVIRYKDSLSVRNHYLQFTT